MRILITGVAGFIGSHLGLVLLKEGHEVLGVDNLVTGQKNNLESLEKYMNFEFLRHDVTIPLFVEVDGIINLACPASPVHYKKDPVQTMKTSVVGAINLLGLAKRLKVPILQASTSEIYGDPLVSPQIESYWGNVNPLGSRSCYDEGKRAAETLFQDYRKQFGLNTKIIRIFNTYGPHMAINDGRVVSNFINQAIRNQDITIYGKGVQTRSFCYVTDTVDGILKAFFIDYDGSPVNIGNPEEITINQLANEILEHTKSKSSIKYYEVSEDDPVTRKPEISKARSVLDWYPKISRSDGLINTIDYFKKIAN